MNMLSNQALAKWLKFLRKEQDVTQQEICKRIFLLSKVWVTDSTISKWEVDGTLPGRIILPAYAEALDVSLDTMMAPSSADFERLLKRGNDIKSHKAKWKVLGSPIIS